jgi:hypothetical protein
MRFLSVLAATLLLTTMGACRSDTLELDYVLEEDGTLEYTMVADAEAHWNLGEAGGGSYTATFDVVETVQSVESDGAVVHVEMTPTDIDERGFPSPGPKERTFTLKVGTDGQVLNVIDVDGVPAEAIDPDELALIGTFRPPLPLEAVSLGDSWPAQQEFTVGSVFQQVKSVGQLESLDVSADGDVADLSYSGSGPLAWTVTLPQGDASLTGSATSRAQARLNIDGGFLDSATSSTKGRFEVRAQPVQGGAALTGTLVLDLEIEIHHVTLG